jgi:hypothetical protein
MTVFLSPLARLLFTEQKVDHRLINSSLRCRVNKREGMQGLRVLESVPGQRATTEDRGPTEEHSNYLESVEIIVMG